ncbi:tetratricopeptide repeat protein [Allosphingosinicella sp.]|jgi:TolA-binding protein|uniref:tetratricopeptide repeat protein n=1 Tax=Allosphingosinicella sp. TaxID=2823234 RepID=UPI002EF377C0
MRLHILTAILLAGIAVPASAQREPVERRIERLEQELRAVQRRVFPNGAGAQVEPEIPTQSQPGARPAPGGSAVADLNARVDALEAQLAALTGQVEESNFRTRQVEEALNRFRDDATARLARIESAAAPLAAAVPATREAERPARAEPASPQPAPPPAPAAAPGDPAEEAYNAGFRLWEARRYEEAQTALQAVAERHPRSRWASWASNLAGRAFLDDGKPATAARIFLANYQNNPSGERAADSLYFLGRALVQLNRRPEACRVYSELEDVYPQMRDWLRQRLPEARREARCTAG